MICSIVLTGCHNIGVNSANKILVEDNVLSIEKEIPFVRYRFNQYTDTEINYIKSTQNKFNRSTHLVEIGVSNENPEETLNILDKLSALDNIAKFIYVDIDNEIVEKGQLNDSTISMLSSAISKYTIDRVMLKDKSTSLDMVATKKIVKQLMLATRLPEDTFGVCSSPLSFSGLACLTAVKAREIMSKYSTVADVALPTANHQCMNCCGCVRYVIVKGDTQAPSETVTKQKSTKEKSGESKKQSNNKNTKVFLQPGRFSL